MHRSDRLIRINVVHDDTRFHHQQSDVIPVMVNDIHDVHVLCNVEMTLINYRIAMRNAFVDPDANVCRDIDMKHELTIHSFVCQI